MVADVTASVAGSEYRVRATWHVVRGRAEPKSVTVECAGDERVSADIIRRLPLGEILGEMRERLPKSLALTINQKITDSDPRTLAEQINRHLKRELGRAEEERRRKMERIALEYGKPRGRQLRLETLVEVAEAYRAAYAAQTSTAEAVATRGSISISISQARKRIQAAGRAGLLDGVGPWSNGKARRIV